MEDTVPVDKFDGDVLKEIDGLVKEYVTDLHRIVYSRDPKKAFNAILNREDELRKTRTGLEAIISQNLGAGVYADKAHVDKIIEDLVAKGLEADKAKLPTDAKDKEERISDYLAKAGLEYVQVVKEIMNTRDPARISDLPDGHPLKTLVTYIVNHLHEGQRRKEFIDRRLIGFGDLYAPAIAEAFNTYAGLELDPKFAKVQEILTRVFPQKMQGDMARYEALNPNPIYNRAETEKSGSGKVVPLRPKQPEKPAEAYRKAA